MGARQMQQVLRLVNSCYARAILSGDVRQHNAVERGDALRLLEKLGMHSNAELVQFAVERGLL